MSWGSPSSQSRVAWAFQDYAVGEIASTSTTITKNQNGDNAVFDTSIIIGGSACIFRQDGVSFAYSGTTQLFSKKIKVTAQDVDSITLNDIPHETWGALRIWYQIRTNTLPVGYILPPLTVQDAVVAELGTLFVEDEQISTDNTLTEDSDTLIPSQKAIKAYVDTSVSNAMLSEGTGISIDSQVINSVYKTEISDTVNSVSVGGATPMPASYWRDKPVVEVLDTILFPDILPTYTIPTISLSGSLSGTYEVGATVNQNLTVTITKNDAGVATQVIFKRGGVTINTASITSGTIIADIASQFGFVDPNNPNYSYTKTYSDTVSVPNGSLSWNATGSYNAGLTKNNNKGVTDTRTALIRSTNAPQASDNAFFSSNVTITGIYPYFWGVSSSKPTASSIASAIQAGTANKVLASASGTVSVTFNASAQYVWMAHQSAFTSKTVWYNTALNNGIIGAGQFILAPVTQNVTSPQGYWSTVQFKIYISNYATTTNGAIEFRNS